MKFIKILFCCLLFFLVSCEIDDEVIKGKVVRVADGDTITLLLDNNNQLKIRLYGIDCPETSQDFYRVAKEFTTSMCIHKTVSVDVIEVDQYGRSVAIVTLPNGEILNEELLKAGLAWHYKHYDQSEKYARLENEARESKLGLWSQKKPMAPWVFRKARNSSRINR